jgi:hypothetical protein
VYGHLDLHQYATTTARAGTVCSELAQFLGNNWVTSNVTHKNGSHIHSIPKMWLRTFIIVVIIVVLVVVVVSVLVNHFLIAHLKLLATSLHLSIEANNNGESKLGRVCPSAHHTMPAMDSIGR